ncbi:hypothetical protein FHY14_002999 [Xanthomonas arboricola]|nr:hypothetical protein [Xanthomonas arboricola]
MIGKDAMLFLSLNEGASIICAYTRLFGTKCETERRAYRAPWN